MDAPERRRFLVAAGIAATLGIIVAPLVAWILAPGLPDLLESSDGFHWVGEETGTQRALLLRKQSDGHQILAGSDRFGIPDQEPVRCYRGSIAVLRDAAKARGRIEGLTLHTGWFHRLTIAFDDIGGDTVSYLYRCSDRGVQPLLSWGALSWFGMRTLAIAWIAWIAAALAALELVRRRR
jgi:hypothetical protein